jgi:TonB-dependent receptor
MEALTTSGAADAFGGANRGRGFDFNVFASELFNSLTVRKTASADVEEGSLGATVDLQTARPFDYREPTIAASAQVGYNDLSQKPGYRFALIGTDTFLDGKLGALVSMAYDKRRILQEGFSTTRWDTGGSQTGFNRASTLPGYTIAQINSTDPATAIYHPRLPAQNGYDQDESRLGVTASIQFRPTDQTLFNIDGLYSKLGCGRRSG